MKNTKVFLSLVAATWYVKRYPTGEALATFPVSTKPVFEEMVGHFSRLYCWEVVSKPPAWRARLLWAGDHWILENIHTHAIHGHMPHVEGELFERSLRMIEKDMGCIIVNWEDLGISEDS